MQTWFGMGPRLVNGYKKLLSNYWGFRMNVIMKCGTYNTVVIHAGLTGSVKKSFHMEK